MRSLLWKGWDAADHKEHERICFCFPCSLSLCWRGTAARAGRNYGQQECQIAGL